LPTEPANQPKKRIVREKLEPLAVPEEINDTWSMDFMHDALSDSRNFQLFNVLDDYNREGLGIAVDLSLPAERVIRALDQIIEWRGKPYGFGKHHPKTEAGPGRITSNPGDI
jgi:putative transposase